MGTKVRSSLSSTVVTSCEMSLSGQDDFPTMYDTESLVKLELHDDDLAAIIQGPSTPKSMACHDTGMKDHPQQFNKPSISIVDRNDLQQISLIGSGQFCKVYSVTGILSQPWEDNKNNDKQPPEQRSLLAFKSIDPRRVKSEENLVLAATDLANEAKILSQLDHKNIIRLRGISNERFSRSFWADGESSGKGFFIVLDILKETLSERMNHWRKDDERYATNKSRRVKHCFASKNGLTENTSKLSTNVMNANFDSSQRYVMCNRIENTVFGIAEGMEYLHSHQIVLRDLKPSNIGFDFETGSQIRLFDFGMARIVSECSSDEICGSPRYMAPEVMSGKGYSFKVDVYSFGVLLFEMCSLRAPYSNYWQKKMNAYNRKNNHWFNLKNLWKKSGTNTQNQAKDMINMLEEFYSQVTEKHLRPADDLESTIPCPKIRALINECWSTNPDDRPDFTNIISRLKIIFDRKRLSPEEF